MENYKTIKLKRFSKDWWENVWYHYKFGITVGICVFVIIAIGVTQCAFQVAPDAVFTYIGSYKHFGETSGYVVEDMLGAAVPDFNGDGVGTVHSSTVFINGSSGGEMYEIALLELAGGQAVAFFMDKTYLEGSLYNEYADMSAWADEYGIDESLCIKDEHGGIVGIDLADNPLFADVQGLEPEGLYLVVRSLRDNDKSERDMEWYENGLELARYIASGGAYTPEGVPTEAQ